jgi:hypothetical protein
VKTIFTIRVCWLLDAEICVQHAHNISHIVFPSKLKKKGTLSSYNRRQPVIGTESCINKGRVMPNLSVQERLDNLEKGLEKIAASPTYSPPPSLEKKPSRFEASAVHNKLNLPSVHMETQLFEI